MSGWMGMDGGVVVDGDGGGGVSGWVGDGWRGGEWSGGWMEGW